MMDFSTTTPFQLARMLAAVGQESPSIYLLISEPAGMEAVHTDIAAEVEVQLGSPIRTLVASEMQLERLEDEFRPDTARPVVLVRLDVWMPKLVRSLDRHVVLMTRAGAVLLLGTQDLAERVLTKAPNLRNRLTDG
jgi:hypothetical protein